MAWWENFYKLFFHGKKIFLLAYQFCRHWHIFNILWINFSVQIAWNADKLSCIVVYSEASTLSICYKILGPQKADKHYNLRDQQISGCGFICFHFCCRIRGCWIFAQPAQPSNNSGECWWFFSHQFCGGKLWKNSLWVFTSIVDTFHCNM